MTDCSNALAYYDIAKNTSVKSFLVQALRIATTLQTYLTNDLYKDFILAKFWAKHSAIVCLDYTNPIFLGHLGWCDIWSKGAKVSRGRGHYTNTYKDCTYNKPFYNINKCDISYNGIYILLILLISHSSLFVAFVSWGENKVLWRWYQFHIWLVNGPNKL